MKLFLYSVLFFTYFNTIAQTKSIPGTYKFEYMGSNAMIEDTMILKPDGTFSFHEYDKHDGGVPPERNKYGKGRWKLEDNIVTFIVSKSDIDDKYTLDFNNSKARFVTKSPRDKSDRLKPTSLKFFKSNILWMVKRDFIKE